MPTRSFTTGRIREARWDPSTQQLDLRWDDGRWKAWKHVPQEVFRRLCEAPKPTSYWEDRIAEEYPQGPSSVSAAEGKSGPTLKDLFGDLPD